MNVWRCMGEEVRLEVHGRGSESGGAWAREWVEVHEQARERRWIMSGVCA